MNAEEIIREHLAGHLDVVGKLRAQEGFIADLARRIIAAIEAGKKVLFFGNGGSAADAQHLAAEFVVRFRRNRRALPAIALTTDTSILTAGANDFGFETVFARQIEALANEGDIAVGISTSGKSPNIVAGLRSAKERGCVAVAFTGAAGGECSRVADITFQPPSDVTARVQECHLLAGHILCEIVESHFIDG
jgi:D-sedoheptulose 7-phosphate isomerase